MLASRRWLTLVSMAGLWLVSPRVQAESASETRTSSRYERGDAAVVAGADPGPDRHRVMLNLGLGSAVGEIGLTHTYAPLSFFHLETGVGLGFTGLQISLMPKFLLGGRGHHLVLGIGPSAAFFGHSRSSAWLNGDVGYEFRSLGGFSLLIAGGFYKGLAGRVPSLSFNPEVDDEPATSEFGPQLRAGVGWWF